MIPALCQDGYRKKLCKDHLDQDHVKAGGPKDGDQLVALPHVNIIYALSLTFKHIGKALCVILVILQIPGSSGTYPIEMTPAFFQKLHPLLPFTYGVNAMREAIAGFYGSNFRNDLLILLLCYVPISLLIGLGLRPALSGLNHLFDKKLAETEFMMCEPHPGFLRFKRTAQ